MSPEGGQLRERAYLNLVDSSRQLFELDPGAKIESGEGWLFGAGRSSHPAISNAAFRIDDGLDPALLLERARVFFGELGRGFSLWVRDGAPEDRTLITAAESAGLREVHAMPEMVLRRRAEEHPLPQGIELRRLSSPDEAGDYWRIAAAAYATNGFPPDVFRYDDHDGLLAGNVAAFTAYLDGAPVSIAMTIVSHGVAGIYWVGSVEEARGRGLGRIVTAAATNAGFDLGAEIASLQASKMGRPIYEAMGFETICSYRLLMSPPPRDAVRA
ncbi:MAG TPA: GNAT family N-acetyltransferase [Solirubrobacterales bacterium]